MILNYHGPFELKYAHDGDAGMDLCSNEDVLLYPHSRHLVGTGMYVEIPTGCVGLIHPRSGLAGKHGITVLNTPGTVDNGYRGEIKVILYNANDNHYQIHRGDRIAQLVIQEYISVNPVINYEMAQSERGIDGFGSTGI